MRLIIIGTGYVGLVTGVCLAQLGHQVLCVDNDTAKINRLKRGELPIFEKGLAPLVINNCKLQRLEFANNLPSFGSEVDAVFIAVGTPPLPGGQGANLASVFAAARAIGEQARGQVLVVIKSTVPVGTGDAVERMMLEDCPTLKLAVASNPEFLREGNAIEDFMNPDRIVVGTQDEWADSRLRDLYAPLRAAGAPVIGMSRRAAELTKYAANAFLAAKIAFINEVADLCEAVDADIDQVALGIGLDNRIGSAFLQAGPGYGGSCFPKDTEALLATAQEHAVSLRMVETTIAVNDSRKRSMGSRIVRAMGGSPAGKSVGLLGLTFKPDTDDIRDAPCFPLIASLQRAGINVRVFDPKGMPNARRVLDGVDFARDPYGCVEDADCLVLATHWSEFKELNPVRLARMMRVPRAVDLRNCLDTEGFIQAGFTVHSIGKRRRQPASKPVAVLIRNRADRKAPMRAQQLNGRLPSVLGNSPDDVVR
jgi:UDPglucose 6-dehydrogenase